MARRIPLALGADGLPQRLQGPDELAQGALTRATTLLVANAETAVLSLPASAGDLEVGRVVRFAVWGLLTNTTTASTMVLRLRVGPATLTGAVVASATFTLGVTARTNVPFFLTGAFTVLSVGAAGTAIGQLVLNASTATALGNATAPVTAAVAINTTVANLAELTVISGAASTTLVVHAATAEFAN
jgi:hypothetical protein